MPVSRRDFLLSAFSGAAAALLAPETPALIGGEPKYRHDPLLLELERRSCLFFFEQADPKTGLVKDRARHTGPDSHTVSSIAATGFGLSALCIAHANGFLNREDALNRTRATLEFLASRMPHQHGFFYHFVDMHTAERAFNSEISSIDTALLLLGVLHAREHFDRADIRQLAGDIYERVDWSWMLNDGETLDHGYKPETGFLKSRWDSYSELMGMYLLAIGSPSHPIPASSWSAWKRPVYEYGDLRYISAQAPLFIHQSTHAWIDFRHRRDSFANYFQNSTTATLAHKRFCLSLRDQYPWYSNELWGITASDSEHGYVVWGGPPVMGPIDGTIVPCAAGGSLVFMPEDCRLVLQTIFDRYPQAWTRYGFVDAFRPKDQWYDPEIIGIDQGILLLMAENLRTGGVWKSFMRNSMIRQALKAAGFRRD
ncbi:MAG: hypothetical protein JOZ10_17715 [Acidobacteria bacterium]|nr:hypothetical protein [Acidobacteriota bacterium]